jgi:hypothetical protein
MLPRLLKVHSTQNRSSRGAIGKSRRRSGLSPPPTTTPEWKTDLGQGRGQKAHILSHIELDPDLPVEKGLLNLWQRVVAGDRTVFVQAIASSYCWE